MTPSQLIHLSQVAGYEYYPDLGDLKPKNKDKFPCELKDYNPHTPEGAAQFRELFLSLDYNQHLSVYEKWAKKLCGLENDCYPVEFTQWIFLHPADACQIIFEVTGGEEVRRTIVSFQMF